MCSSDLVDILDTRSDARGFLAEHGWTFPSVFDATGAIRDGLGLLGQPVTLFYAADGTLENASFATGLDVSGVIALGLGGAWGTDLYARGPGGTLLRIDALGMATTAEGIESRELATTLAALGCASGQGYFFAKPLATEIGRAHV